jgi:hypothetical protein
MVRIAVAAVVMAVTTLSPGGARAGNDYVPPVTNPVLNEPPQIITEVRPVYMYQEIPGSFVTTGGRINLYALQFRIAINERWALIATKDGYADASFDAVLDNETGFANLAAGVKYAAFSDSDTGTHVAVGARYEAPTGSIKTGGIGMQSGGDGLVDVFASGVRSLGERAAIQGSAGLTLAVDSDHDSSFFHSSVSVNCEVSPGLYGLLESNLYATVDDGSRSDSGALGSFEGSDLLNFGSTDSGTVVTGALGLRYRVGDRVLLGLAYELPLTSRKDLIDKRVTIDVVWLL